MALHNYATCDMNGCTSQAPMVDFYVLTGHSYCPAGGGTQEDHTKFHLCTECQRELIANFFSNLDEQDGLVWVKKKLNLKTVQIGAA